MSDNEFADINDLIKEVKYVYQIYVDNEELNYKVIGKLSDCPDVVIQQNFGYNNKFNLHTCLYTFEEIFVNHTNYIPILKLTCNDKDIIAAICVQYGKTMKDFEIFYTFHDLIAKTENTEKLDKVVNKDNIIEILLAKTIDQGIQIL